MRNKFFARAAPLLPILTALLVFGLSACAASQPAPLSPAPLSCAAESQAQLSARAGAVMTRDARANLRKLSILAETSRLPAEMTAAPISPALQSRAVTVLRAIDKDFKAGRGLMRLTQLSERCQNSQITRETIDTLLGVDTLPPSLAHFVTSTGVYQNWVSATSGALRPGEVTLDIPLPRMEEF